jgi:alpha-glucosidase
VRANKHLCCLSLIALVFLTSQCKRPQQGGLILTSPDGKIKVAFMLENGVPYYQVSRSGQAIIKPSKLGFTFQDDPPLDQNLAVVSSERGRFDETWTQPWGEVRQIRNHYNELRVNLEEISAPRRKMSVVFRVYDDGLGFRYELPAQENLTDFEIMDEETEFVLAGDHQVWWIPAYQDRRHEYLYTQSPVGALDIVHTPLAHPPDRGKRQRSDHVLPHSESERAEQTG